METFLNRGHATGEPLNPLFIFSEGLKAFINSNYVVL
jgi:hypothetical protein